MIFKVCGMRDPENIRRIDLSGADWMGFVFYPPSPRRVESLPAFMPEYARRVGVFVDEPWKIFRYAQRSADWITCNCTVRNRPTTASDCKIGDSVLSKRSGSGRRATSKRPPLTKPPVPTSFSIRKPRPTAVPEKLSTGRYSTLTAANAVPAQRRHRPGTRPGL